MSEIRCATALALAAFVLGCRLAEPEQPPDIILIAIDTLRADHLGAYGYDRPTSPALDRLAREGVLFANAHSPSSWTHNDAWMRLPVVRINNSATNEMAITRPTYIGFYQIIRHLFPP